MVFATENKLGPSYNIVSEHTQVNLHPAVMSAIYFVTLKELSNTFAYGLVLFCVHTVTNNLSY